MYKTCFYSQIPIPSYLLAITIGNYAYASQGPNTGILADPSILATASHDLQYLQIYLNQAEVYVQQPYVWGNFTAVIMPPNYPMGSMENPMLAFISPTVLTGMGDAGSQAFTVNHCIAHSWVGNGVAITNWEDIWVKEAFAVYIERAVDGILYHNDYALTEMVIGNYSMMEAIQQLGMDNTWASIHPVLNG